MTREFPGVAYLSPMALAARVREEHGSDILGIAAFGAPGDAGPALAAEVAAGCDGIPIARVAAPPLGSGTAVCEVWQANGPFVTGQYGAVRYRANGQLLFGALTLPEGDLRETTGRAYAGVFGCMQHAGFPHLLRTWNYLAGINRESAGIERYRLFNEARQASYQGAGRTLRGDVPAACALGSREAGSLVVYFLAAVRPGASIENPRQVPAYDYPAEYGEYSPTFSRAMLVTPPLPPMLLVSGTASIRGARSVHPGDAVAQAREIVANLRALVVEANRRAGAPRFAAGALHYKAYLRHAEDLEGVRRELVNGLAPDQPIVWLLADICRAELLVEIEAAGFGVAVEAR